MVDQKKEDFMSHIEHYRAVLEDLHNQRNMHRLKINEIEQAIASLHRLIPADAKPELPSLPTTNVSESKTTQVNGVAKGDYSDMSVRWAILKLLTEYAVGPMTTGAIAVALKEGGLYSSALNFAGNVSAILSVMSNKKMEVVAESGGWVISQSGKQAWAHIRAKREAEAAQQSILPSSSVQ